MPIPKLEKTCARYLDSQRPMLSAAEYEETKRLVQEFEMGTGRDLDNREIYSAAAIRGGASHIK
jgi:hypothetical protein